MKWKRFCQIISQILIFQHLLGPSEILTSNPVSSPGNFSQNAVKIKYAEFLNPFIWTGSYNIFKYHQVYMDMIKEFELVGLDKPTEEQQAIDFLYSLSPEFTTMQAELRNNENRVRAMPATRQHNAA